MLIDAGANPRARNHDADSAVLLAAQYNAPESLAIVRRAPCTTRRVPRTAHRAAHHAPLTVHRVRAAPPRSRACWVRESVRAGHPHSAAGLAKAQFALLPLARRCCARVPTQREGAVGSRAPRGWRRPSSTTRCERTHTTLHSGRTQQPKRSPAPVAHRRQPPVTATTDVVPPPPPVHRSPRHLRR
eukprot:4657107-Prymnesium_polylepis.1